MTEEHKNKIRQALIGNKNSLGIKHSAEWTRKIANSLIGKKRTAESRKKMSLSHIGVRAGMTGKKQSLETKAKISASRKGKGCGENNGNWIKDRTQVKQGEERGHLHKEWSLKIRKRDNWRCRINDKNCEGKVVAHHILPWSTFPELRYAINNGITLCHHHHPKTRADEKRLIPELKKLVES